MNTYKIADLMVNIGNEGEILKSQAEKYITANQEAADITVHFSDHEIIEKQRKTPYLSMDECKYILTGFDFYNKLLDFNGFMLHASAVAMDNRAYLFSAACGAGKSTHTSLWQKYFGEDRAVIINDDKPAIRFINQQFYAYGTPWSGKTNKNIDMKVPLQSIVFIERSETNWVDRIDSKRAIKLILEQTIRSGQIEKMDKLLGLIDRLLKTISIYKMGCDISENAVCLAHSMIK